MIQPRESGRASARKKEQGPARDGAGGGRSLGKGTDVADAPLCTDRAGEGRGRPACLSDCKKFRTACSWRVGAEAAEGTDAGPWKTPKAIHAPEESALFWGQLRASREALSKRDAIGCTRSQVTHKLQHTHAGGSPRFGRGSCNRLLAIIKVSTGNNLKAHGLNLQQHQ